MGVSMSEPVVDKDIDSKQDDRFYVGSCAMQGWRITMEDSHTILMEMPGDEKAAFFAVFDGHGGSRVSELASRNLHSHIVNNENYKKGNYEDALKESFLSFDAEVRENFTAGPAGTTAVCYLIADQTVYCANIGDSRGIACVNGACVELSRDHKPENPLELSRIISAGGYVQANRVNGNLALSRAFGDFQYKDNANLPPDLQVVSPYPEIQKIELNEDLDFLVLACDGVWDVLSSEEVLEFVVTRLRENMRPDIICEQITTRCLATDYELVIGCDNMTIVLICYTRGLSFNDYCAEVCKRHSLVKRDILRYDADNDGYEFSIEEHPENNESNNVCIVESSTKEASTSLDEIVEQEKTVKSEETTNLKLDVKGDSSTSTEKEEDQNNLDAEKPEKSKSDVSSSEIDSNKTTSIGTEDNQSSEAKEVGN